MPFCTFCSRQPLPLDVLPNIFSQVTGHTVLGVFLGFIALAGSLWPVVIPASILGQVGIGMLELFVAFLQAYVFALLTSLFISAAVNPH